MEELVEAFPNWTIPGSVESFRFLGNVIQHEGGVKIVVPFDGDVPQVKLKLAAHDWKGKSKNTKDKEKYIKNRANAVAKLKLLGLSQDEIDAIGRKE